MVHKFEPNVVEIEVFLVEVVAVVALVYLSILDNRTKFIFVFAGPHEIA